MGHNNKSNNITSTTGATIDSSKNSSGARSCFLSLACSIGSISIACGTLLQLNSYNEKISVQRGCFLTSLGFVYFISLTDFFNKYFLETQSGRKFRQKYHLMISDVLDITNKAVSTIQAALSCVAGFIVCNSSCRRSFLTASHYMSDAYAWFGTAYFIYDIWSMYKVHAQKIADKLKISTMSSSNGSGTGRTKNKNGIGKNGNGITSTELNPTDIVNNNNNNNNQLYDKIGSNYLLNNGNGVYNTNNNSYTNKKLITRTESTTISNKCNNNSNYQQENVIEKLNSQTSVEKLSFFKYCLTHPIMIFHHIFIGSFGLFVIVYLRGGFGDCVYGFIYLMEFSTPYVSIRSILSIMGLKKSRVYVVNGLIMLITFFICRILMWPYLYYWYSEILNVSFLEAIASLPRACKIGTLILFCPQIYWFILIVKGAIKVFFPKEERTQKLRHAESLDKQMVAAENVTKTQSPVNITSTSRKRSTRKD